MIFNRTQKDVDDAKIIINEKVKKFLPLTEEETSILERGTITINTINRIEEKQAVLKVSLDSQAYYTKPIINHIWDYDAIFDESHFKEIIKDTYVLRDAFFVYASTPKEIFADYTFQNINNIEHILFDIGRMLNYVVENYIECGVLECGEG